jgi:p24 family protein gamma-5
MTKSWQFLSFTIFIFILICQAQENTKPWYEALPAVAMDYKVHIDAGKEDCYYQYVQSGATFYVSFQVRKH